MACGADVNATNKWDWTPLHLAATNGMTETALRLVQLGANLYATVRRRRRRATRASARGRERGGHGPPLPSPPCHRGLRAPCAGPRRAHVRTRENESEREKEKDRQRE